MADSENSNASDKKVKTEQTASETIVGDASAEIKDSAESSARHCVRRTRNSRSAARMQRLSIQDFSPSVRTSGREMKRNQVSCTT